jgi:hypothetical protein
MSTFGITASGNRGYTINAGSGQYTGASIPSKTGDEVEIQGGSLGEVTIAIPRTAKIVKHQKGEDSYYSVVLSGSLLVRTKLPEGEHSGTPHLFVRGQAGIGPFHFQGDGSEIVSEQTVAEFFGDE